MGGEHFVGVDMPDNALQKRIAKHFNSTADNDMLDSGDANEGIDSFCQVLRSFIQRLDDRGKGQIIGRDL